MQESAKQKNLRILCMALSTLLICLYPFEAENKPKLTKVTKAV